MISIKWSVDYTIYTNFNEPSHLAFSTSNIGLRTSRHACRPVVANVTFQYPTSPLLILQFLFMCNDNVPLFGGGLPLDVLSILETAGHNVVMGLWRQHLVLSGGMFTGSDRSCIFVHVLLKQKVLCKAEVWWNVRDFGKMNSCCFFMIWPQFGGRTGWCSSFDSWARALAKLAVTNEFSSFRLARRITSHYLNQCWFTISNVHWYSFE